MNAEMPPRTAARIAGFAYLMVFIFGILGNVVSLDRIIVPGDAVVTAGNIIAKGQLFRFGIASWMIVIVFDAMAAWALYLFLKPVDRHLALLAAWFRLIFVAIFGYSFVNLFSALHIFSGVEYLTKAYGPFQLQAQAMQFVAAREYGMHVSFLFFGLHIFLLGYLILKSRAIPRTLGILLIIASAGYMVDCFGNFLSPSYSGNKYMFLVFVAVPAVISEFYLTMWLLIKGGKSGYPERSAPRVLEPVMAKDRK